MTLLLNCKKITFLLGILVAYSSYSQKNDTTRFNVWADVGIGAYAASSESTGFSPMLGFNVYHHQILYKIRYIHAYEFELFGPTPAENLYSLGAMVGKGLSNDKINVIFSTGLGITAGVIRGDFKEARSSGGLISFRNEEFEKVNVFTPGIPLEVDFLLKFTRFFGAGFTIFADLNIKRPYLGWAIKLSIGKLR